MVEFNVGDIITFIGADGERYVEEVRRDGKLNGWFSDDINSEAFWERRKLINVDRKNKNNKNNMSNIIDTIKLSRKNEPEKSLIKAGLTNMEGSLTSEGRSVLEDFLVTKFGTELKTQYADPILEEKAKENK